MVENGIHGRTPALHLQTVIIDSGFATNIKQIHIYLQTRGCWSGYHEADECSYHGGFWLDG